MVHKIVPGGQTGVDRAALDVAMERGLSCGGWCPKGRLAEDGTIPSRYPLEETLSSDYAERTLWNVRDSDGTLILTWGSPTDGTAFTVEMAARLNKPCRIVDLAEEGAEPHEVLEWIRTHRIRVLNVAGPRAGKAPEVYGAALRFLHVLLDLLEAANGT